jgi:hypothetical protein
MSPLTKKAHGQQLENRTGTCDTFGEFSLSGDVLSARMGHRIREKIPSNPIFSFLTVMISVITDSNIN